MKNFYLIVCFFLNTSIFINAQIKIGTKNLVDENSIYKLLLQVNEEKYSYDKESLLTLNELEPILKQKQADSLLGRLYRIRANVYSNLLNKEKAFSDIDQSIFYFQKAKKNKEVVLSTMNKGNLFLFKADNKKAIAIYTKALQIAQKDHFQNEEALLNKNIGVVFQI